MTRDSDSDPLALFIEAASPPWDDHAGGTLDAAEAILAAHPGLREQSLLAAAILGDAAGVRRFLERDPQSATAKGGPRSWDPLTSLCFSRYLRLDPEPREFVDAAAALLDAGARPNSGFEQDGEFECVLYGAAGVAHHPELTRLLLERGADPNDGEVTYHAPESYDNRALMLLVESGRLTADSLATMLLRKHDWHDGEGVRWLLEHGADPNRLTRWHGTPFQHALKRDNALEIIAVSLDHGADPNLPGDGGSAGEIAARRGRSDVLERVEQRDIEIRLQGVDRLLAACARDDAGGIRTTVAREPGLVAELVARGGEWLAGFAGVGNAEGVGHLLDLGVPPDAGLDHGDGYWGLARNSTALHVAAWRARPAVVRRLIDRGATIDARDGRGRTPLALAVQACVDSYWKERRTPDSIRALLEAGASAREISVPTGYAEADALLARHGSPAAP